MYIYIKCYSKQGSGLGDRQTIKPIKPLYECIPNHFKPRRGLAV
jgi:hypothetical protein